jgi:hypothetical protein
LSQLTFGIESETQYIEPVLVQRNVRHAIDSRATGTVQQFGRTDLAKALKSKRPFFITARRRDTSKFVSSRYDRIDFDAILSRIETNCPFDAETLMSDVSERERAERGLAVSQSDMALIRLALNKRYGSSPHERETGAFPSQAERDQIKRFAAENGLPASQYLTAAVIQKFSLDKLAARRILIKGKYPATGISSRTFEMETEIEISGNKITYFTPIGRTYSFESGSSVTQTYPGMCNGEETTAMMYVEVSGAMDGGIIRLNYSSRLNHRRGACAGLHNYYTEVFSIALGADACSFTFSQKIDRRGPNMKSNITIKNQKCLLKTATQ